MLSFSWHAAKAIQFQVQLLLTHATAPQMKLQLLVVRPSAVCASLVPGKVPNGAGPGHRMTSRTETFYMMHAVQPPALRSMRFGNGKAGDDFGCGRRGGETKRQLQAEHAAAISRYTTYPHVNLLATQHAIVAW